MNAFGYHTRETSDKPIQREKIRALPDRRRAALCETMARMTTTCSTIDNHPFVRNLLRHAETLDGEDRRVVMDFALEAQAAADDGHRIGATPAESFTEPASSSVAELLVDVWVAVLSFATAWALYSQLFG